MSGVDCRGNVYFFISRGDITAVIKKIPWTWADGNRSNIEKATRSPDFSFLAVLKFVYRHVYYVSNHCDKFEKCGGGRGFTIRAKVKFFIGEFHWEMSDLLKNSTVYNLLRAGRILKGIPKFDEN